MEGSVLRLGGDDTEKVLSAPVSAMVGGGGAPSSTGSVGGPTGFFPGVAAASETDGDTFDGDGEFDEYDEWDYQEMLAIVYVHFSSPLSLSPSPSPSLSLVCSCPVCFCPLAGLAHL